MDIEKFNPTVAELTNLVELTKGITATDLGDKKQIEVVKQNRIALRDARVAITKKGKELREEANAFNKAVIAKEKELIAIIEPEEERLKAIEEEAKKIKVMAERKAVLPEVKKRFEAIGDGIVMKDQEYLALDENELNELYNKRVADKNTADRLEIERKAEEQRKEAERLENEKNAQERAELARKEERERADKERKEAYEREQREKLEARIAKVRELGLTLDMSTNAYVLEDFYVPFLDIQTMDDISFAELVSKIKLEMNRRAEEKRIEAEKVAEEKRIAEEKAKQDADAKYQNWLKENGYEGEGKGMILRDMGDHILLYKFVAKYNK